MRLNPHDGTGSAQATDCGRHYGLSRDALRTRRFAGFIAPDSHVAFLAQYDPTALVAAGGAGEIFSLTLAEHEQVLRATMEGAGGCR